MKKLFYCIVSSVAVLVLHSCSTTPAPPDAKTQETASSKEAPEKSSREITPVISGPSGVLNIDVTNILGNALPSRIELFSLEDGAVTEVDVPKGEVEAKVPAGTHRTYTYVYDQDIPVLVDIQEIIVKSDSETYLLVNLLEGASDILPLRSFDYDGDLAIDRVELAAGTDPENAASVPGKRILPFEDQRIASQEGWYAGELHARSNYGVGTESIAQLIRRAERDGMDFLAITDRNTMDSVYDDAYQSGKVVLIPAMEWGNSEKGVALIYGPRTMPDPPGTYWAAQAECIRVQAQGGVFAIAHPCFSTEPWLWGLSYVNAVQVWSRGWREVPPIALEQLPKEYQKKDEDGRLVYAISRAASSSTKGSTSANAQAERFWNNEMNMGLMAGAIGGSGTASPGVPMGKPVTYVYAKEKSLPAILEGLRLGRTYVSRDMNGPKIEFVADVLGDGKIDVGVGGVVPVGVPVEFEVRVGNAVGKKLQVLMNGDPIITKIIEGDGFVHRFKDFPKAYSVYRARVVGAPPNEEKGFGPLEVYAMTSAIYAQDITRELVLRHPELNLDDTYIQIRPTPQDGVPLVDHLPEGDQPLPLQRMY